MIDKALLYFEALAELHLLYLKSQRNEADIKADNSRRKFVARFFFRKLVLDPEQRKE